MSSLREIKDRIGSVKSTLKITSAMKLVASSKLRKAQKAIETLRPYEETLCGILASLTSGEAGGRSCLGVTSAALHPCFAGSTLMGGHPHNDPQAGAWAPPVYETTGGHGPAVDTPATGSAADEADRLEWQTPPATHATLGNVRGGTACGGVERSETVVGGVCPTAAIGVKKAVVVISSNSSLCGGFNGNVVKKALEVLKGCGDVELFAIGRRGADALRKAGYPSDDWSELVAKPSYALSEKLAKKIAGRFSDGEYSQVILVYNHFVTTAHQEVVIEQYLPFAAPVVAAPEDSDLYIIEPGREEVLEELVPKVTALKFHAAILDSAAAEHAARTVAMQTATDNAQDLLDELTLEYNKGRQQKITSEILDLLGGKTE